MQRITESTSSQQPGHYSFHAQTTDQSDANLVLSPSERTGRKSYKLARNRGRNGERKEPVWPPILEEALLDGLRRYRPFSKSGRPLLRFTKRNVSISNHIFHLTGMRRSAKQVGSRLQQITESTKDAEIIRLITCRKPRTDSNRSTDFLPSSYATSPTSTPVSPHGSFSSPHLTNSNTPSSSVVAASPPTAIETFEECTSLHAGLVSISEDDRISYLGLDADLTPQGVNLILTVNQVEGTAERELRLLYERVLSDMPCNTLFEFTPTLSIISWRLSPETQYSCTFTVSVGNSSSIHVEECPISVSRPTHPGERFMFVTEFLPSFWSTLPPRSDLKSYSITVDVYEVRGIHSVGPVHRMALAIGRTPCPTVSYPYTAPFRLPPNPDFGYDLPLTALPNMNGPTTISDLAFNHMSTGYNQMTMSSDVDNGMSSASWTNGSYYIPYTSLGDARFLSNNQDSACPDHLVGYSFQQF
ncbi:hypothetical protein D9619_005023 [Psilocybe cf. subviscida]|uniref:TEA domain-containing protein n=1 Tax=Psilocybe cf. subviscida TaxID=2480587 RepID=A0A8H5F7U7_9AGAR|nr:hypothetical protein D9619_005023 [Psilocybe cf. subviscida]